MGIDGMIRFMRKIALRNMRRARREQLEGFKARIRVEDMRARDKRLG